MSFIEDKLVQFPQKADTTDTRTASCESLRKSENY